MNQQFKLDTQLDSQPICLPKYIVPIIGTISVLIIYIVYKVEDNRPKIKKGELDMPGAGGIFVASSGISTSICSILSTILMLGLCSISNSASWTGLGIISVFGVFGIIYILLLF